jgi:hypothetical protein
MVCSIRLTALFVMSLIAFAPLACAAQSSIDNPDTVYKLEGTVVNAETGRPIPRALVQLYYTVQKTVLAGPQGEFSFDKLPKGTAMIRVQKPGFFDLGANGGQRYPFQNFEIGPDSGKAVLKLEPESTIAGEVTDENGDPVEGAAVEAVASRIVDGHREFNPAGSYARTDEDGLFRMAGLEAGKYFLTVKASSAARQLLGVQSSKVNQSYPLLIYFPGVTDMASATPFDLAPGQHAHAQISLSLVPAFKLAGTVLGVSNFKQVSPPMIVDAMEQPLTNVNRWDAQTGAFEFPPLPAGVYTLRVYAMADDNRHAAMKETVKLNRDVSGLTLAVSAGVTIPVSVQTEFTELRDCSDTTFSTRDLDCKQFPAMVTLILAGSRSMQAQAPEGGDGPSTLALRNVMPGRYRLQVHPMVQAYVRSARSGSTNLLRDELIVPAGGTVPPIEVVLRDDGAKIDIHVQAEKLPPLVHILLLPEFAPSQRALSFSASGSDDVQYAGLAPGDYKVLAFESTDAIEYENPEVMQKYSAKTAHVTLTAHGSSKVTVELIREGE